MNYISSKSSDPSKSKFIINNKKHLSNIFGTALFIGCSVFVAFRGYDCFKKFLSKPEKVDIHFKFSGTTKFPSITFCSETVFDTEVFEQCQLDPEAYRSMKNPKWVSIIKDLKD